MTYWRETIGGCFDADCLVFAGDPAARKNARVLREKIREAQIPAPVVETAFNDWLHEESSNTGQIYEQMARVKEFFDF